MFIPPFSIFSAVSELLVTAGVFYMVRLNWTRRPFPLSLFVGVALFEALVNVVYMAGRASRAAAGVDPISPAMKASFAAHGTLSLLAYLAFVILAVFAWQDQRAGRYFFRERPALTWTFLAVWTVSVASGEALFQRWTADLESFRSASMRARSAERLAGTRARYDAIVSNVEPAFERLEVLNGILGDSVLFLANDLNASSIAALRGDVDALLASAKELSSQLEVCLSAADGYMRSAALPEGLGQAPEARPKSGA